MRASVMQQHEALSGALEHLLNSGGKRVRPAAALLAAGVYGAPRQGATSLAAAVEMLHTASLVHDDLIDGSLLRRGIPTLNAQWSPAATVLTGDYLFARAADLAAETDSVEVMRIFARTLITIVNGEINQMFRGRGHASRDEYYRRIYAKTASLFASATQAGAVLGGAAPADVRAMQSYGREVGTAFQIVDDVLDFVGDESQIGKPVGSDLRQGLVTLPALYYLESHPHDPTLRALLSGDSRDPDRLTALVNAIRNSDAIGAALAEAGEFVRRGQTALRNAPDGVYRRALLDLGDYILSRNR